MSYPKPVKTRQRLDSLTGIKSSLNKLRSIISLLYLLYLVSGKKSHVDYSISNGDGTLSIEPELLAKIKEYFNDADITSIIEDNPLFRGQYEALYVGIALLFQFANIKMQDSSVNNTAERTGGKRYPKMLDFASNMIALDLILAGFDDNTLKSCLKQWLENKPASNVEFEKRVTTFISVATQNTLFKIRDEESNEIFFRTEGLFESLVAGEEDVTIDDSKEAVGPTRIYRNVIKEGLDPWLKVSNGIVSLSSFDKPTAKDFLSIISTTQDIKNVQDDYVVPSNPSQSNTLPTSAESADLNKYLRAMRTKPFLLLAGISGTGKSRIVKQLAYKACPDVAALRRDTTSPGNYCLVEVKPNWHDSTELLGYTSHIGQEHYVVTKFVQFVAKAMLYPEVPFFLCLDEMNLAPVEQYFAEFLSVLESRKVKNCHITSEPLIPASIFAQYENTLKPALFNIKVEKAARYDDANKTTEDAAFYGRENEIYDRLKSDGLRIPENLIVIGTVNMDETTHQFSRKVIDRAMTIEMNIEDGEQPFTSFFEDYEELAYTDTPLSKELFLPRFVSADEALQDRDASVVDILKAEVPVLLGQLNQALNGTPFKIAYRVQNELILYFNALLDDSPEETPKNLLTKALDDILMMKVLPRIEGDEDTLKKPLNELHDYTDRLHLDNSKMKIEEMQERLDRGHFTSFWP